MLRLRERFTPDDDEEKSADARWSSPLTKRRLGDTRVDLQHLLEDLREDFVPSGFVGYKLTRRAVQGHEYGLRLTAEDKAALIAFLKTL